MGALPLTLGVSCSNPDVSSSVHNTTAQIIEQRDYEKKVQLQNWPEEIIPHTDKPQSPYYTHP